MSRSPAPLFTPFKLKGLTLPNRIVMAPMTRSRSPSQIPGEDVAAYYRRRAEGGVGLIITEGTAPAHPVALNDHNVPNFHGDEALAGWAKVLKEVKKAGGHIMPQLWHTGLMRKPGQGPNAHLPGMGPSGLARPGKKVGEPMTAQEIDEVIEGYAISSRHAKELGFDGVEIHGAHGYIVDQFFWDGTNERDDVYGGDMIKRTKFATDVIRAVRAAVGPDFPVILRWSQWKQQDFTVKLAPTPQALEKFLEPLTAAGVDCFHCSTRRFWEPEFEGSTLNLAGWTKKLTGLPTITVGSVGLNEDFITTFAGKASEVATLDHLIEMFERGEFDLVAVGRALIVNPNWANMVKAGKHEELVPYHPEALAKALH
ncbi:MAG: 12-oxophytodienoate reductase [Alphaproteobacteria bacterium]|nr:12-oxophytodienoate reductase [Alphaproteobacteria bacterium]